MVVAMGAAQEARVEAKAKAEVRVKVRPQLTVRPGHKMSPLVSRLAGSRAPVLLVLTTDTMRTAVAPSSVQAAMVAVDADRVAEAVAGGEGVLLARVEAGDTDHTHSYSSSVYIRSQCRSLLFLFSRRTTGS